MKKSRFNLTHLHSTTLDPGYLVPFLLQPTLPNDSYRIGLSTFIRAQPMLAPLMHEVNVFTQYWFCPYRILWDDWEDFITGGNDLSLTPAFPTVVSTADDAKAGTLWDYLGFPLVEGVEVSAMPFRAMAEIWNTRYRDEDLQVDVPVSYDSGVDDTTSRQLLSPSFAKDYFTTARPFTQRGGDVLVPVNNAVNTGTNTGKEIEFFVLIGTMSKTNGGSGNLVSCNPNFSRSSILVGVQKWLEDRVNDGTIDSLIVPDDFNLIKFGSPQTPLVDAAGFDAHVAFTIGPSMYGNAPGTASSVFKVWVFPTKVSDYQSPNPFTSQITTPIDASLTCPPYWVADTSSEYLAFGDGSGWFLRFSQAYPVNTAGSTISRVWNDGIYPQRTFAQLRDASKSTAIIAQTTSVSGFTIRDLRRSAALQRYAERSLKYGNRYEEFIQREFGIKPRDYRIQRPEYLGGGRGILNISEVLQTAEAQDTGVGTMRGHGVASVSQRAIKFRCPEHGLILGLLSIRPKSVYTQGVDREWLKRSRLDFFTPELASIGMQEVLQQEIFATSDNAEGVFGYSERYQEYRYHKPMVTGEFRTNLNFWNMSRIFENSPNLNGEFINMSQSVDDFKRPFQIQDNSAHAFVVMLKNHIRAFRPIPKRAKDVLK